jgi:chromosome segregation ATPase
MIRIEKIEIEEFRGIRKLIITPNQKNLGISGPNGTGKSGVVDAVEFALTGSITRLPPYALDIRELKTGRTEQR